MPVSTKKAPKVLPKAAQSIWVSAFNSSWEGTCKERSDRDACASRIAWAAVKKSFHKNKQGEWVRSSNLAELSMFITKAVRDEDGKMVWAGVVSDTQTDMKKFEMTPELFQSFIEKAEAKQPVDEEFQTPLIGNGYWNGGMPYLSLAHYPDLDGEGVPGWTNSLYMDGDKLKAKGEFYDTPLGNACFEAIQSDMENHLPPEERVRFSIGFLDFKHFHKASETTFERKSRDNICIHCVLESLTESGEGIRFLDGHLVHLGLTRIPVNTRTTVEVSHMTTRKEDAESIVPKELVEKLEALLDGDGEEIEQALVTQSEEGKELLLSLKELVGTLKVQPHPLDAALEQLKAAYDKAQEAEDAQEALKAVQPAYEQLAEQIQGGFSVEITETPSQEVSNPVMQALTELTEGLKSFKDDLGILNQRIAEIENRKSFKLELPQRSLSATATLQTAVSGQPAPNSSPYKELSAKSQRINLSVGNDPNFPYVGATYKDGTKV